MNATAALPAWESISRSPSSARHADAWRVVSSRLTRSQLRVSLPRRSVMVVRRRVLARTLRRLSDTSRD